MIGIDIELLVGCDACDLSLHEALTANKTGDLDKEINNTLKSMREELDLQHVGQKMLCSKCYSDFEHWTQTHKVEQAKRNIAFSKGVQGINVDITGQPFRNFASE